MRQVNLFATMQRLGQHAVAILATLRYKASDVYGWSRSNNEPVKSTSEFDRISLVGPLLNLTTVWYGTIRASPIQPIKLNANL